MKKYPLVFTLLFLVKMVSGQELSLMTYNIRYNNPGDGLNKWEYRKENLVNLIAFYEPDIIGFQEVLPDQLEYIASPLSTYNHVGLGRETNNTGESMNIFFKKSRFKRLDENTFWLSPTPQMVSRGWDAACNRVCTYVLMYDEVYKKEFYVFNTHLDHMGETARLEGIRLILSKVKTMSDQGIPCFLMGDMNATPDSEVIRILNANMHDSRAISQQSPFGPLATFNDFKYDSPAKDRIDYIYLSNESPFKVMKHGVLTHAKDGRYPSDHFPILIYVKY
ncbi:MAG: endonuclease/exonuclease/phosphatase family protein [Chitinophagales bacterium]|nr:endonuclease/exonuclease/phosphatase family protein [Chitinophagales bacterium]